MQEMDRSEAESKFGFSIYQGHGVPVAKPRIVEITGIDGSLIDAEACGGIHAMGIESIIGTIKIIGSQRIHDGIDRLEYVAGLYIFYLLVAKLFVMRYVYMRFRDALMCAFLPCVLSQDAP